MKKIALFLLIFLPILVKAQTIYFTLEDYQLCFWNERLQDYDNCQYLYGNSLLSLNSDETVFKHITEKQTSLYYVVESSFSEEFQTYRYDVKSDTGNDYIFFIDLNNNIFKALGKDSEYGFYLSIYMIKKYSK